MSQVLEIVGIAGCGKSTLTGNLRSRYPDWNYSFRLPVLRTLHWQVFALLRHAGILFSYSEKGEFVRNCRLLMYIEALPAAIKQSKAKGRHPVVFDQGVIYAYASLRNIGLRRAERSGQTLLHLQMLEKYIDQIDGITLLTADRKSLEDRIFSRESDHRLKHFSDNEIDIFFRGYDQVFQEVINLLREKGKQVVKIDTSDLTEEQVFDLFLERFGI